jgi:membrane protein DedA with SNARE-associated domain
MFLAEYGKKTIFAARFLPGIRMPTFLICGTLRVPMATFLCYDGLAMLISVPIQVYLSWRYGSVLDEALRKVARLNQTFLCIAIVVVLLIYYRIHSGGGKSPAAPTPPPTPRKGD